MTRDLIVEKGVNSMYNIALYIIINQFLYDENSLRKQEPVQKNIYVYINL